MDRKKGCPRPDEQNGKLLRGLNRHGKLGRRLFFSALIESELAGGGAANLTGQTVWTGHDAASLAAERAT